MRPSTLPPIVLLFFLALAPAMGQHHTSNWVLRSSTDTTIVPCWSDSLNFIAFPPNCMMMMMPDSFYCRFDRMGLDSLPFAHDSTFMGWYRVAAGRDSMHFDLMQADTVHGRQQMMQFLTAILCHLHWDSVAADSGHRGWRLTGVKVWDGTAWLPVSTASIAGDQATFVSPVVYPAIALIGAAPAVTEIPGSRNAPTAFALDQNYPNPFNPTTLIRYDVPVPGDVSLVVYNLLGMEVKVLVNERKEPGRYAAYFNAAGLPSGMYFYRLSAQSYAQVRRMIVMR